MTDVLILFFVALVIGGIFLKSAGAVFVIWVILLALVGPSERTYNDW